MKPNKFIFSSSIFSLMLFVFSVPFSNANVNDDLIKGALTGNIELVESALNAGASVNIKEKAKGNTALMLAAYYNHPKIVDLLINSKADVSAKDDEDNSALTKAAWTGSIESAKLLIRAGANVNAKEVNGMTPLMVAAFYGHTEVVKLLVQENCDISIKDNDGFTAVMNAKHQGHDEIVEFLSPIEK